MEKEYVKIGEAVQLEDGLYFQLDNSGEGDIFKDEYVYEHDFAAPCYVPESSKDGYNDRYPEYDCKAENGLWYSHQDLLKMCFDNHKMCDTLFALLKWETPETCIARMDGEDFKEFWNFVQNNAQVRWCGPIRLAGTYTVASVPDKDYWDIDEEISIRDNNGDIYKALLYELKNPTTCRVMPWRVCRIPSYAVCAIENDDYSGLEEEDIKNIKVFLEAISDICPKGYVFDWDRESLDSPYFCRYPEFGLACDVVDVKIYKNL